MKKQIDNHIHQLNVAGNLTIQVKNEGDSSISFPQYLEKYIVLDNLLSVLTIRLNHIQMQKDGIKIKKNEKIVLSLPLLNHVINQEGSVVIDKGVETGEIFTKEGLGKVFIDQLRSKTLIKKEMGILEIENAQDLQYIEDSHGNISIYEIQTPCLDIKENGYGHFFIMEGKIDNLKLKSRSCDDVTIRAKVENAQIENYATGNMEISVQSGLELENLSSGNIKVYGPILETTTINHAGTGQITIEDMDTYHLKVIANSNQKTVLKGSAKIAQIKNYGTGSIQGEKFKIEHAYVEIHSSGGISFNPEKTLDLVHHWDSAIVLHGNAVLEKVRIQTDKKVPIKTKKVTTLVLDYQGDIEKNELQAVEQKATLKIK